MNLVEYIQNLASKSTNDQLENLAFRKVKLTESVGFIEIMKTINQYILEIETVIKSLLAEIISSKYGIKNYLI